MERPAAEGGGPPGALGPPGLVSAPPFAGVSAGEVKRCVILALSRKIPSPERAEAFRRRLEDDFSQLYAPPDAPEEAADWRCCRRTSRDLEAILELLRAANPGMAPARPQDLEVYINKALRYASKEPMRREDFDYLELCFLRYALLYGTPDGRQLSAVLPAEFLHRVSDNQRYGKVHRLRKKYPKGGA